MNVENCEPRDFTFGLIYVLVVVGGGGGGGLVVVVVVLLVVLTGCICPLALPDLVSPATQMLCFNLSTWLADGLKTLVAGRE